ncbi:MAG: Ig-like domain-containing protein, partial [Marmoricola sp.]
MHRNLRRATGAAVILGWMAVGGPVPGAQAVNTPLDCSQAADNGNQVTAIEDGGNQDPSTVDFLYACTGDALTIGSVVSDPANGTVSIVPADPADPTSTDTLSYTPTTGFHGHDSVKVEVDDSHSGTTEVVVPVHVMRAGVDTLDCGSGTLHLEKRADSEDSLTPSCYSSADAPADTVSYALESVLPAHTTFDASDGTVTYDDQITSPQVTLGVIATDGGTGDAEHLLYVMNVTNDPSCTAVIDDSTDAYDGYAVLEQRANNPAVLSKDLG